MLDKTKSSDSSKSAQKKEQPCLHKLIHQNDTSSVANYCKSIKSEDAELIEEFDNKGDTALILSIKNKHEEITDLLLSFGANPNQQNKYGETPLIIAVQENAPTIMDRLIEEGADINKTNSSGDTALKIATKSNHKECINILKEHGATYSKNSNNNKPTTNATENYLSSISEFLESFTKGKNIESIFNNAIEATETYLEKHFKKNDLLNHLSNMKDYIQERLNETKSEKNTLRIIRKLIESINKKIKIELLQLDDTHSIHLMSKAENFIEDKITRIKHMDSSISSGNNSTNQSTEEDKNKTASNLLSKDCKIFTSKILCKTSDQGAVLAVTASIKPHEIKNIEQTRELLSSAEKFLNKNIKDNIGSIIKEYNGDSEIKEEHSRILNTELRHGKNHDMHILHFAQNAHIDESLHKESIDTGATIHCIQYNPDAKILTDLVLTGIANINKLLDDGVHPDKIILQGKKDQLEVITNIVEQFAERGVTLTHISLENEKKASSNHRSLFLSKKILPAADCPQEIAEFFEELNTLKSKPHTKISENQIVNFFIQAQQKLFAKSSVYRNPALPNERVDDILDFSDGSKNDISCT